MRRLGVKCPPATKDHLKRKYRCKHCKIGIDKDTEHCYDCKVCVNDYDHHCMFFSKCIGGGNTIYFRGNSVI